MSQTAVVALDPDTTLAGVLDRTLPKAEWTHEAHVAACWAAVRAHGATDALTMLRAGIKRYNEATGVANTPTSGYHETITRYFVATVGRFADQPFASVLTEPSVQRDGPLAYWSKDLLFTPTARAMWVEPDLQPLR